MMRYLRFHPSRFMALFAFWAIATFGSLSWIGVTQAAVVYEGSSSGYNDDLPTDGSAGALTLTRPTVAKPGMVMIASIAARPHDMTWTAPAGWTQLSITAEQPDGGSSTSPGGMTMKTFYKVVGVSEPNSYTWTFANTYNDGGSAVGGMLVYSGIDTSGSPLDGTPTSRLNASSTTQRTTAITTTVPNAEVVAMISYLSAGTFSYSGTICSGITERLDVRAPDSNNAVGTTLQMGNFTQASPGTTCAPRSTANGNADTGLGHLLALKPSEKDLVLALSRSGPLTPGGAASYTMTITNAGTQTEPGPLTIISTLPTGLSYVSASGTGWSCSAAGSTVTCQKTGSLAVGAAATPLVLNVNVAAGTSGEKTFSATASGTGGDGNTVNNTATDTYVIPTTAYAEYRMDETSWGTILDSSGNGRNASTVGSGASATPSMPTPPGAAITGTPGTCGAGKLPNTTGANGVSTPVDVNSLGNAGTIAFWYASSEGWRTNNRILFDASNELGNGNADKHFYLVKDSNGRLVFALEDNADTDSTAQSPSYNFAANTWHHIAVTWDLPNDRLYVYLDGDTAPVATSTTNVNGTLGDMATLYLGAQRNSSIAGTVGGYTSNTLNGYIDEVRLYGSALSAAEIADIADRTHSCGGVSIATPGAISEGNSGTSTLNFTVSLDSVKGSNVSVNYATSNGTATGGGSCTAGVDYVTTSGTLTIPAGSLTGTVPVTICGDTMYETNETFTVTLSSPVGVLLGVPSSASGTINNDDNQPSLSLADTSAAEGNSGTSPMTFTVTLSNTSYQAITVNYSTADGTATGASSCSGSADYQSVTSGTATIAAGAASGTFSINLCGDATNEPDETFNVTLSSPTNATLGTSTASGTITNDDLYCYTDTFTGANNSAPSSDWRTTSSSGAFGQPRIYSDRLRLTDASTNVSTAAHLQKAFPGAGNKIIVEFDYYAYNGSGADGIALTFSDASVSPYAGAYGGSLGYAQKTGINGFAGGWLGIGIDEYGNFRNDEEGRGNGGSPTGLVPDSISVRGSGSGTSGYLIHVESGSLSPGVDQPGATAGPNHKYRITIDHMDGTHAYVKVERNTGSGYTTIIPQYDAKAQAGQAAVPTNWLLSFTGSTGSSTNIHEIDNLQVCAYQPILPLLDHIRITHDGSGGVCTREKITFKACIDASCNTLYNSAFDFVPTTSPVSGSWYAAATGGSPLSAFTIPAGASVDYYLAYAKPNDATLGVGSFAITPANGVLCDNTSTGTAANSTTECVNVFSDLSFTLSEDSTNKIAGTYVGVAGRPHDFTVTATKWDGNNPAPAGCGADGNYTGAKSLKMSLTRNTSDPGGAAPTVGGTSIPNANSTAVIPLTFSNGIGTFNLVTTDVGKYTLNIADDSTSYSKNTVSVSANQDLTVRPFALAISDIKAGTTANPGTGYAVSETRFLPAGDPFQATIGGYLHNAAADTDDDGLPDASATQTQVVAIGTASKFTAGLSLTASLSFGSETNCLGPAAGTYSVGTVNFSGGQATPTNMSFSEVGCFKLVGGGSSGEAVTNYLGTTGVNLVPYVYSTNTTRYHTLGRFYPKYFALSNSFIGNRADIATTGSITGGSNQLTVLSSAGIKVGETLRISGAGLSGGTLETTVAAVVGNTITLAAAATVSVTNTAVHAGNFTYMGEPFAAAYTLTALNANGGTTANYSGSFARLAGSSSATWTTYSTDGSTESLGIGAVSGSTPLTSRLGVAGSQTGTFTSGVGRFSAQLVFNRATNPDGPYTVQVGIAPQDKDGVRLRAADINLDAQGATTTSVPDGTAERGLLGILIQRFGRLRIANAFGSEHLALPMTALLEYYSGGRWVTNTDDSLTRLSALGGPSMAVSLTPSGSTTPRCNVSGNTCTDASGVACNADSAITSGNLGLCLTKPDVAGQADISFAPPAYLQLNGVTNPSGRAGFGIYNQTGNSQRIIHRQELR